MAEVKIKAEVTAFDIKRGIRKLGESNIGRTDVGTMLEALKADELKLVESAEGVKFLHIINTADEQYFTVKVGKTVDSKKRGDDLIVDLVSNYTVYCGETENGPWFTFGRIGATGDPLAVMTVQQLTEMKVKYLAGQ